MNDIFALGKKSGFVSIDKSTLTNNFKFFNDKSKLAIDSNKHPIIGLPVNKVINVTLNSNNNSINNNN